MKPRIEKKLSKRLSSILSDVRGFTLKDVWIDDDVERFAVHYKYQNKDGVLTSKQKRQNYEQNVSVNNIPSIGGGLDYWGEANEHYSVFEAAKDMLVWAMFDCEPVDPETLEGGWPDVTIKLTGKNVVALAKKYVERVKDGE